MDGRTDGRTLCIGEGVAEAYFQIHSQHSHGGPVGIMAKRYSVPLYRH